MTGPVWYSTVSVTFLSGDVEVIVTVSGLPAAGVGTDTDAAQKVSGGRASVVVVVVVVVELVVVAAFATVSTLDVGVTAGWLVVVVWCGRVLDVVVAPLGLVVDVVVVDPGDNVEPNVVVDDVVVVVPVDTFVAPPEPVVAATSESAPTATTRTAPVIRADNGHALSTAISRDMTSYLPRLRRDRSRPQVEPSFAGRAYSPPEGVIPARTEGGGSTDFGDGSASGSSSP